LVSNIRLDTSASPEKVTNNYRGLVKSSGFKIVAGKSSECGPCFDVPNLPHLTIVGLIPSTPEQRAEKLF